MGSFCYLDPGLVHDIQPYGYMDAQVTVIVQQKVQCSFNDSISEAQLLICAAKALNEQENYSGEDLNE
ncbi:hypothetical protein LINPERHAP1_LOCUS33855 [Linum perenne]